MAVKRTVAGRIKLCDVAAQVSKDILNQILNNQQRATEERGLQGQMITEIRTVLLGTKAPETPGLLQNFNAFREKTSGRLGRLEKGVLALIGVGSTGGGTVAYWDTLKHMVGL